jgi:hypothetical protein
MSGSAANLRPDLNVTAASLDSRQWIFGYTDARKSEPMPVAAKRKLAGTSPEKTTTDLSAFVPRELRLSDDPQTLIPRLAKDEQSVRAIEQAVRTIPTTHDLYLGDSRSMSNLRPESVHLVLTSPPYWTLKEYRDSDAQLGHVEDYERFV